jgi:1,4-dihydroxy-2-naphthoate octaprenyltransferase
MDLSTARDLLEKLRTEHVMEVLRNANLGDLIYNPWFLTVLGIICLVAIILKRQALLILLLTTLAYACVVDYTLQQKPAIESAGSSPVLVFAGGGVILVFLFIYYLFIRQD